MASVLSGWKPRRTRRTRAGKVIWTTYWPPSLYRMEFEWSASINDEAGTVCGTGMTQDEALRNLATKLGIPVEKMFAEYKVKRVC